MTDILLFMSDQHSYGLQGYTGNGVIRTPNLDRLARTGTSMANAYTACPLCVPARAAMISGELPSHNGVLFNFSALDSNRATFLHSLHAAGYDTVLCGRMHFIGPDQRHGFARRIAGDRTPVFPNNPPKGADPPTKVRGYDENSSLYYIGPGDSPVLAYDRYVVDRATAFLGEDHETPFFLTVGTYGPHFPYVAPPDLFHYYYDKVPLDDVSADFQGYPALEGKMQEADPDVARAARAAYYGLVEQQDRHIGTVYDAFQAYLQRTGHDGIFIYVSDHGDMNGTHGYYGKQVFYEPAVHIPFLLQGSGIPAGQTVTAPVSLLDLGKTICAFAGAQVLPGDGEDLSNSIITGQFDADRMVVSELYTYLSNGDTSLGRMIRWRDYKYFTFSGFPDDDVLYHVAEDPDELHNLREREPAIVEQLRAKAAEYPSYNDVMVYERWVMQNLKLLIQCRYDNPAERWVPPVLPELENPIQRKVPFAPTPWAVQMRNKLREP